jgi:hypothetical protein
MLVLDYSLRILIAAAAVGLVLASLRVASGAARHAAWSAVAIAMLTMPVLTMIVPKVDVPVPSALALDPGTITAEYAGGMVAPANTAPLEPGPSIGVLPAASRPAAAPQPPRSRFSWKTAAVSVYIAGVCVFMLRLLVGWSLTRKLLRRAYPVPADGFRVVESRDTAAPLTIGVLSPTIVLPFGWRAWTADTLRAVLAHEQAHVVRRDPLVLLLARMNRAIFWFHPLAWWLVRAISTNAEHACDERAIRQVGEPLRYAEVLIDMASAVNARGSRVAWPAIGVDGSGSLAARIDRLLRGDVLTRMSRSRRVAMAMACGAALLLPIACRQQVAAVPPLRPDPEVSRLLEANKLRTRQFEAAVAMSTSEVSALDASLQQNPADIDSREKLLTYYRMSKSVAWNDKLSGMRRHALWFIEHAPDGNVGIPVVSQRYDPEGYEEAKRLWLEHTSRPDVSVHVISRAADFLSAYDKPLAEELLLRGRGMDPAAAAVRAKTEPGIAVPSWSSRLGSLYARAIVGNVDASTREGDPALAATPFAAEARRKLDASTDAQLLQSAARFLMTRPRDDAEHRALGRTYLERALQFDPDNVQVKASVARAAVNDRLMSIETALRNAGARDRLDEFSETTYTAVWGLPVEDRLFYLPHAAESAYLRAEYIDFTSRDKPEEEKQQAKARADAGWNRARRYAEDALSLAAANPDSPEYAEAIYRGNIALAVLELKEGNRQGSVEYMERAGNAPASEGLRHTQDPGLRFRLVEYLLREGERGSVAAFLEKSAALIEPGRERLRADAARIRDGVMPQAFQHSQADRE